MLYINFVCLGNICRSPMAEAIFKKMVEERGLALSFHITSCGTSACEEGNPVYPPAAAVLRERGYNFSHRARQITLADIKNSDYVLVMDGFNMRDIMRLTGGGYAQKIFILGHFLDGKLEVDDPWYTHDFERAYGEIYASCEAFLNYLLATHREAFNYDKRN